jgi:hypothetical protein
MSATLTQRQYSRTLTQKKWLLVVHLVRLYNQERHRHIATLQSLFGQIEERTYRNQLVQQKYQGFIPARLWKMALTEAYQLVHRHWALFGMDIRTWGRKRSLTEGQKLYLMWLTAIPECVARLTQGFEVNAPAPSAKWLDGKTLWTEQERIVLERLLHRWARKHKPTHPKPTAQRSMALDQQMWNLRKTTGGSCLRIACAASGKRISLPLLGFLALQGNLRLVLQEDNTVEIHDSYEIRSYVCHGDPRGIDLGQSESFVDHEDEHWGSWMPEFIKKCEATEPQLRARQRLWSQVRELKKLGHHKKARRIVRNNLGTIELKQQTQQLQAEFLTKSRADIRSYITAHTPSVIVTEELGNFAGEVRKMNRTSNSHWRHASFHEGLQILGRRSGTTIVTTPAPYASCTCPQDDCAYPSRENRSGDQFLCKKCNHQDDADRVGASAALKRWKDPFFPAGDKGRILHYLMDIHENNWKARFGNPGHGDTLATAEERRTAGTASELGQTQPHNTEEGNLEHPNINLYVGDSACLTPPNLDGIIKLDLT